MGAELDRANATSLTQDPSSKLSIRDNIKVIMTMIMIMIIMIMIGRH